MPFSFKAFPFKKVLISLLISFIKIIKLILNTLCSIITFFIILLKSTIPVLGQNLTIKILAFVVLLFIKKSLINPLKSSK